MLEAGFARTQGVAVAPEVYGEGWAARAELDATLVALREWGDRSDAFTSWLYCGALGWVD